MKNLFYRIFLNDRTINIIILLNISTIICEEYGYYPLWIEIIDNVTIFFFIFEMIAKQTKYGFANYWRSGWNRLDGSLVVISLPSIGALFFPSIFLSNASFILSLRILRVFRFFRLTHFFPNFSVILTNFKKAMRDASAVILIAFLMMVMFALICCSLFNEVAPEFFCNPGESLYSIFRLFTIEGWYEIPDTVAASYSPAISGLIRLFFAFILILGGIICMSLINSIFVDAMVSDNNDEMMEKIDRLENKIDAMLKEKGIAAESTEEKKG